MLFVKLDTNWADNPKVIAAGLDGAGLHAMALCLAKRTATDGVLHRTQLARLGGTPELIARLVDVGLLDDMGDGRVRVHDWLSFNPSNEALSKAAREGNHKRWGHPGPVRSCPKCSPGDPQAIANSSPPDQRPTDDASPGESPSDRPPIATAIAPRSGAESEAIGETETETETETENNNTSSNSSRKLAVIPDAVSPSATARDDTQIVFDAWCTAASRSGRTRLDDKRRRIIRSALKAYPVDDLVDAVRGWRNSPFHAGENENRRTYNDLGLILRDSEHIERFRDLERYGPERVNGTRPKSFDAIARVFGDLGAQS